MHEFYTTGVTDKLSLNHSDPNIIDQYSVGLTQFNIGDKSDF